MIGLLVWGCAMACVLVFLLGYAIGRRSGLTEAAVHLRTRASRDDADSEDKSLLHKCAGAIATDCLEDEDE